LYQVVSGHESPMHKERLKNEKYFVKKRLLELNSATFSVSFSSSYQKRCTLMKKAFEGVAMSKYKLHIRLC
jgi:hypothetical protein